MTRNRLLVAILALVILIGWILLDWDPAGLFDRASDPGHAILESLARPTGGDFTLSSSDGAVHLADLRGQVVLIYFGYTACPDVCPTSLFLIASALRELSESELARVRVLFVSVDPERDDVQRLADYAAYFHPGITGITGTPEQVAEVAARYGASYRRSALSDTAMGYLVDHSANTYVVDASGTLVSTLEHGTLPDEILKTIRESLAGTAPETAR